MCNRLYGGNPALYNESVTASWSWINLLVQPNSILLKLRLVYLTCQWKVTSQKMIINTPSCCFKPGSSWILHFEVNRVDQHTKKVYFWMNNVLMKTPGLRSVVVSVLSTLGRTPDWGTKTRDCCPVKADKMWFSLLRLLTVYSQPLSPFLC